jgi:hypothetical protein
MPREPQTVAQLFLRDSLNIITRDIDRYARAIDNFRVVVKMDYDLCDQVQQLRNCGQEVEAFIASSARRSFNIRNDMEVLQKWVEDCDELRGSTQEPQLDIE